MSECRYHCRNGKLMDRKTNRWIPCPDCTGVNHILEMKSEENQGNIYEMLRIPKNYRNMPIVTNEVLLPLKNEGYNALAIENMSKLMTRVHEALLNGRVPSISCMMYVPSNKVDIKSFVYSMQRVAMEHSVGCVPYISVNTLALLRKGYDAKTAERYERRLEDTNGIKTEGVNGFNTDAFTRVTDIFDCDYFDYVTAQLVFVEITASTQWNGWIALSDLLEERSKMGLPTFVVSHYMSFTNDKEVRKHMGYLLKEGGNRLDLLTPFDIYLSKGNENKSAQIAIKEEIQKVEDNVASKLNGLSLGNVMNSL